MIKSLVSCFFFKQKTAYEILRDWSSDVCSSDLKGQTVFVGRACKGGAAVPEGNGSQIAVVERGVRTFTEKVANVEAAGGYGGVIIMNEERSEEHKSELHPRQYLVCLLLLQKTNENTAVVEKDPP